MSKAFFSAVFFLAFLSLGRAQETTLVNLSSQRPVLNVERGRLVSSRTLAPESRLRVETQTRISGLGLKHLLLKDGGIYYVSDLSGRPLLYELQPSQVLVLNASEKLVAVTFSGTSPERGVLNAGNFALTDTPPSGKLSMDVEVEANKSQYNLEAGKVYRLVLVTDETGETRPAPQPWD